MTRSQQFIFYKLMELFTINTFVITVMKCSSQHLRKDRDVAIFSKVSWTVCPQFFQVSVQVRVGMDYTHQTVNHTTNFVEPRCGAHLQTSKSFWHPYKIQNKCHCGTHGRMGDSYLCEFMWRQKYMENDLFMQILNDMNEFHPLQSLIKHFFAKTCLSDFLGGRENIFRWGSSNQDLLIIVT